MAAIVDRLDAMLEEAFGSQNPILFNLPSRSTISPDDVMFDEFTMMFAGGTRRMKEAFRRHPEYWLRRAITWLMRRHESPRPCP